MLYSHPSLAVAARPSEALRAHLRLRHPRVHALLSRLNAARWAASHAIYRVRFRRRHETLDRIGRALAAAHGHRVLAGPFAGMSYLPDACGSVAPPKLLGSYEAELHPILRGLALEPFDTVVDVGCAEGYYAVGLARTMPEARVLAFDSDERALRRCATLAQLNGVQNLELHGAVEPDALDGHLAGRTLVLCDCEGAEARILDPARAPRLRAAHLLVELHEHLVPGVEDLLRRRFQASHEADRVAATPRGAGWPGLDALPVEDRAAATQEHRVAGQAWLYLRPRRAER